MMAGIVLGEMIDYWRYVFVALIPTILIVSLLRRFPHWQTAGIYCIVVMLGIVWSNISLKELHTDWPERAIQQDVVVVSEAVVKEKFIVFDALTAQGQQKIKCRISRDKYSEHITIGQGLQILSKVEKVHEWHNGHFDYQRYMQCHGFCGETFVSKGKWRWKVITLEGLSLTERIRLQALCLRHKLLKHYREWNFTSEEYGVVAAMTLGDKSQLNSQIKDIYSQVGASHVLALSGLHLMIIYAVISLFIGWRQFRTLSQVLIVLSIWAFAFLVGLSPSVVRSAFMITIYALLSLGYRERMSVNTLAFTAIVMLIINPFSLYDVGFQLSFMAVWSIVLLNPLFLSLVPLHVLQRHRWLNTIWGLTTVSVSAQIGTAPLVAYYFGKFPTYFLLSNFIVIPLATAILYLTLSCLVTFWWTGVQQLLVVTLGATVSLMNSMLTFVANLPKSSVEGISLSTLQVYLIYIIIACLWILLYYFVQRKNIQ